MAASPTPRPSLLRRLAAILYDTLLVLPIIMLAVALALGVRAMLEGMPDQGDFSQPTLHPQLVQGVALLTVIGFYTWFWRLRGQTLGMQAWRIQLQSKTGGGIGLGQAVLRCLGAALSALPAGAGYLWCLIDREGKSWHDHLSGTELVLLPKRDKNEAAESEATTPKAPSGKKQRKRR